MGARGFFSFICMLSGIILIISVCMAGTTDSDIKQAGSSPLVINHITARSGVLNADNKISTFTGALIIDHNCTNISKIPPYWINKAKELTFHFAHTSHGSQINTGLEYLENQNPTYKSDVTYGDYPPRLPDDTTALRLYDGNGLEDGNTYITPDLYWEGDSGLSNTRYVSSTGLFNYSMWSWCGQASSYTEEQINQYLSALNQLETEYPDMRFIYMTGHSDGGSADLTRNNNLIRQYVRNNNKILFDFNDIEMYSPDGAGPYYNDADGYCEWCEAWCSSYPEQCTCLDDCMGDCAHTHKLFCKLKASAFWWMMARLAGWDGTPVGNPPVASFTVNCTSGTTPLAVKFTDTSTGGTPTAWNWSFGDGTWFNTTTMALRNTTKVYPTSGSFVSRLQVSNSVGTSITTPGTTITVTNPIIPPVADFNADPTSGSAPLTVRFNDTSTGGTPTAWNWSFGDGTWFNTTTMALRNNTKVYPTSGSFVSRLQVSNSAGNSITTPGTTITVTSNQAPTISSISPIIGYPTQNWPITINGINFRINAIVTISNTTISKSGDVVSLTGNQIVCVFPINQLAPGVYNVTVKNEDLTEAKMSQEIAQVVVSFNN